MSIFMANSIEEEFDNNGLTAAQDLYRAYFINTKLYLKKKAAVDTMLISDGYGDCIVTA